MPIVVCSSAIKHKISLVRQALLNVKECLVDAKALILICYNPNNYLKKN